MADITVVSFDSSSGFTQPSVNVPASPAVQKGDLIIGWSYTSNTTVPDLALSASSAPGYNEICAVKEVNGFDSHETLGVYKIAQGGEEGELIQWKTSFDFFQISSVIVLRGVDTTNPFDVPVNHNEHHVDFLDDSTIIFPTMSTTTPGAMVFEISAFEDSDNTVTGVTNTSVGTNTWFEFIDAGGTSNALGTYKTVTGPQLVGGNTHSYSGADTDADGTAFIFVVRPKNKILMKPSPELVTNGGFDTNSDWTSCCAPAESSWSISGGVASKPAGSSDTLSQNSTVPLVLGRRYLFTYTVSNRTAGSITARIRTSSGTGRTTNGTFTELIQYLGGGPDDIRLEADSNFDGDVDNVSVKEVKTIAKPSTELITNGGFDTNSDWNLNVSWSIADGVLYKEGGVFNNTSQNFNTQSNKKYLTTFTVASYSGSGQVRIALGASGTSTWRTSVGTYTEILTPVETGYIRIISDANFSGSIDNVSVKEVKAIIK